MVQSLNRNQLEEGFLRKLYTKCNSNTDNHSCMMLKLILYMNKLFKKSSVSITENIRVTENKGVKIEDDPDDDVMLARSAKSDDETMGILLADKMWKFIRSRTLKYKLANNADLTFTSEPEGNVNFGLSVNPGEMIEEARHKKKEAHAIFALFAAKAGIIFAIFLKGLILLTGKAFIVSKIALILALILALKKLVHKKHVSYEVVSHHEPHHDVHSGWGRTFDSFFDGMAEVPAKLLDAQELAYGQQKPDMEF
ncbi:hypothetical protein ACFFRR_006858 [Megaselia abdita]